MSKVFQTLQQVYFILMDIQEVNCKKLCPSNLSFSDTNLRKSNIKILNTYFQIKAHIQSWLVELMEIPK